jgi:hypothetical protein
MAHKKSHGKVNSKTGGARKSQAQTPGQYTRDPKRRTGQFTGAGDPPMMKK